MRDLREEAVKLVAESTGTDVLGVHEVVLRDHDMNDEDPRLVTFIPIGPVLGIAIKRTSLGPVEDADIAFVSMQAFASAVSALGLLVVPGAAIVAKG